VRAAAAGCRANHATANRNWTPSLRRMLKTSVCTVRRDRHRSVAISGAAGDARVGYSLEYDTGTEDLDRVVP
jgi:hypothetical protein